MDNWKQITNNQDSNWNIWQDENSIFQSIAIKEGCNNTYFCHKINYIIGLIYKYKAFKISDFTEYGTSLIDEYLTQSRFTRQDLFNH